jgi:hypothetical protein
MGVGLINNLILRWILALSILCAVLYVFMYLDKTGNSSFAVEGLIIVGSMSAIYGLIGDKQ